MRRVGRVPLPATASAYMTSRNVAGATHAARCTDAKRLWTNFSKTGHRTAVEGALRQMNGGVAHCMYCERDRSNQIDHFSPKAHAPARVLDWDNLNWSCSICNLNKGASWSAQLLNPTDPGYQRAQHFGFNRHNGELVLLTADATASEPVYGLNDADLASDRWRAWVMYQELILSFHRGNLAKRARIARATTDPPLRSVLAIIIELAVAGDPLGFLEPGVAVAVVNEPAVLAWV